MDKVLITGTSCGVGKATAKKFLDKGYLVIGLDWKPATIAHENYVHYDCDVSDEDQLPDVDGIKYLVNKSAYGEVVSRKKAIILGNESAEIYQENRKINDSALKYEE